jgi:NAD(P)H-hydrate repair Nnr-like enzyme with NAD(P)H-hydrate epimerase domain
VDANTKAYQDNYLKADMSQNVWAGVGGNGGDGNYAKGGDVDVNILNDSLNSHETYHIDGHG